MAKVHAAERNRKPDSSFALPSKRKYLIHDLSHAKLALSQAARKDSEGSESTVRAKVLAKYPQLKGAGNSSKKKKSSPKKRTRLQPYKKG